MSRQSIIDRFMSKVEKTNSCWNWKAFIHINGYGRLSFNRKDTIDHIGTRNDYLASIK